MNSTPLQPYRVLFPIGLTSGLLGAGVWPLHAFAVVPYPGIAHRVLMIQGFEQGFVLGFLLTAMPGFTKGEPCRPLELWLAAFFAVSIGVAAVCGATFLAQFAYAASVLLMITVIGRRLAPAKQQ